jgi:hypothetical protein
MKSYLKYGASAVALLAALSLAQAQERQERGGARQQTESQSGGAKHEGGSQHQGAMGEHGSEGKAAQGQRDERSQRENMQPEYRRSQNQGAQTERHRTVKETPSKEEGEHMQRGEERESKDRDVQKRESNAGAAGKNEELRREGGGSSKRASIHVSGEQKRELHTIVGKDASIHRYRRGDVHFSVNVGSRIPDEIQFIVPPPRFVEIDPDFRNYRLVVLDDEILVVDPDTREIVDVIPI